MAELSSALIFLSNTCRKCHMSGNKLEVILICQVRPCVFKVVMSGFSDFVFGLMPVPIPLADCLFHGTCPLPSFPTALLLFGALISLLRAPVNHANATLRRVIHKRSQSRGPPVSIPSRTQPSNEPAQSSVNNFRLVATCAQSVDSAFGELLTCRLASRISASIADSDSLWEHSRRPSGNGSFSSRASSSFS